MDIETKADSMKKATSKPLTEEQKTDLAALETLPDAEIDTSDIPEVVNWPDAQRGPLLSSRQDADHAASPTVTLTCLPRQRRARSRVAAFVA